MFGLASLDVLIGLITIYLIFSLACTAIVEAISSWMNLRSKKLEAALNELFAGHLDDGRPFVDAFYAHPLVQSLSEGIKGRPSYIPSEIVGRVVQSLVMENSTATSLKDAVAALPAALDRNRIKGLLATFVAQGVGDMAAFRNSIEIQFDAVMDRASGWVKRRQQTVSLIVSIILVVAANVDTFSFATALSASPELRAKMLANADQLLANEPTTVASAETDVDSGAAATIATDGETSTKDSGLDQSPPDVIEGQPDQSVAEAGGETDLSAKQTSPSKTAGDPLKDEKLKLQKVAEAYVQATTNLADTGLKFGWQRAPKNDEWVTKVFGLLISVFAISLGAPFWFDVLKRFMQIRQSGASPREKKA